MTYLLIDVPIKITNKAEPDTLCLAPTAGSRVWWVASSRFLLVVHQIGGGTLLPEVGEVWEVSLGWHFKRNELWDEELHTPFVLPENVGKAHAMLTFRRLLGHIEKHRPAAAYDIALSTVMKSSPRFDRPGGWRGSEASQQALRYPRGVKYGDALWLTKEAAEKLEQKIGKPAKRNALKNYLSRLIMEDEG